jgi:hypothetical protein
MARRRRKASYTPILLVCVAVALAALAWMNSGRIRAHFDALDSKSAGSVSVAADRVDPANEGRHVHIAGQLEVGTPARDEQLGVGANAAVLLRKVEMYQWREHCSGTDCTYEAAWSRQPIDSRKFRRAEGHENPPPRLADARFASDSIRVGAFSIAADVVAQGAVIDLPVHTADLPPNLAASFSDANGTLYAGGDPAHPKIGEVRVSYAIVPPGNVELSGVQRGSSLVAQ